MNKYLLIFSALIVYQSNAQKLGSFIDSRDDQTYTTVTYQIRHSEDSILEVTWMAENLKFRIDDSFCLENKDENCEKYGRYYTWYAATNACPEGWRLPSDEDWFQLVNLYGGMKKAGRHLKSKNDLWPNGNGTNKSLFSGLASGAHDHYGVHFQLGYAAFFWSSTLSKEKPGEAYDWSFVTNSSEVRQWGGYKLIYNCVRCVK